MLGGTVIFVLDCKLIKLGTEHGSYTCLVSLAIGITYGCQIYHPEEALVCCSFFFSFIRKLLSSILSVYYSTCECYNFTKI